MIGFETTDFPTCNRSATCIGMVDGLVDKTLPCFHESDIFIIGDACKASPTDSAASRHGTAIARILISRSIMDPGLSPDSRLIVRPVFHDDKPQTNLTILATAIVEVIRAGARVVNLSLAIGGHGREECETLRAALDFAAMQGAIVVAAAGNAGALGEGALLLSHPAVIPVAACDETGRVTAYSNLGSSIGMQGVMAPGRVGAPREQNEGSSIAAAIVSGTLARFWSSRPHMTASQIRYELRRSHRRKPSIVPPLLDCRALIST